MSLGKYQGLIKAWFLLLPALMRGIGGFFGMVSRVGKGGKSLIDRYWWSLNHFRRNLIVGAVIALLIHLGHGTAWIQNLEDTSVDLMNLLRVDTEALAEADSATGYTFIDMDEKTFTAWNEPYHVPRDKLTQLIRFAAEGGAKAIIVDVDLSRQGVDADADKALRTYLQDYPKDGPALILMRTLGLVNANTDTLRPVRTSFVDSDIKSPSIHRAQPLFSLDIDDLRIRRWRLIEAGCLEGKPVWLPSPQLLVVLISETGPGGWKEMRKILDKALPPTCAGLPELGKAKITLSGVEHDPAEKGIQQRVIYSFSDRLPIGDVKLGYQRLPAYSITESARPVSTEGVKGRVVVIGASYVASRDIHYTPVGTMPGALIITNAVKSLSGFGKLQGPPTWVKLLIETGLIVLMAWAFARFSSIGGIILTGLVVAVVLAPISFYLFKYGIWVDMAAPILGMQLHEVVADYEEGVLMKRRLKDLEAKHSESKE